MTSFPESVLSRIPLLPRVIVPGLFSLILLIPTSAQAVKTDVVVVKNGDSLTGEVKGLSRGMLSFKTEATETIQIKWDEVVSLFSTQNLQVELYSGILAFGAISPDTTRERMTVLGARTSWSFEYSEVVTITPIKKSFWGRIDGSVSLGLSYVQATNILQLFLNFNSAYRVRKFQLEISANSTVTVQDSSTTRQGIDFAYTRFLPKKFLANGSLSLQENREQGFDLRVLFTGGGGYFLVKDNHQLLSGFVGLTVNVEEPVIGETTQSLEAALSTNFQTFTYHDPKRDLNATFSLYPSLTESGRVRLQLDVNAQWEIVDDFNFILDMLESYDTKPPTEGASKNDLTVTTSLGYSF